MFGSLLKVVVGVAVDLPVSIVKDTFTLGGSITNEESAIKKSLETVGENLSDAVDPNKDLMD